MTFNYFIKKWQLIQDGEPIITHSSELLPVLYQNKPAMLKIALSEEERLGAQLMIWWDGEGAAPIFEHEGHALLMQRAVSKLSLITMAKQGFDDEASRIICSVVHKLHSKVGNPPPLLTLSRWFKSLKLAAECHGGIFKQAFFVAQELLQTPKDEVVLHGDIHHGNILDFGKNGWLAIDPKHIQGERGYDYANLFCNPDAEVALSPGRLQRQIQVVAKEAQLDSHRLLKWIFAYAGLSAAWSIEDQQDSRLALAIANIAGFLLYT